MLQGKAGVMERYFGPGVQTVRQTMLRQEEIFQEQVCELHRLYNVQRLLMAELTKKSYDKPNLPTSNPRSDVLQSSSGSILLNLGWQSSFWDSPANKSSDNTRSFDKAQQLLPCSSKTAKSEHDVALDSHCQRSDSRQVARFSGCCRKLDLESLPDEDLDDDFDDNEYGHQLEKGSKTIDASCSLSNMEDSQVNAPTDISLCLGAGWGSSMVNEKMKQSGSFVSSLLEQGHGNDALRGLKRLRSLETVTFPLYPTVGNLSQSLSKVPEETSKDERWGSSFETSPDLEKKSLRHKNQIRNEEPVNQGRKFSDSEADEKLAKISNRPPPWLSQVSAYGSKEPERSSRLSSQFPTFLPEQGHANDNFSELQFLHGQEVKALHLLEPRTEDLIGTNFLAGSPTKLVGDDISVTVASPMISLGVKVELGANALSIYAGTGSTGLCKKTAELSSDRVHTNLLRDSGVLQYDTPKYDRRALSEMQSGDSEKCFGLAGQGVSVLDTNLSVGKGSIQETFSGLWPGQRNLSEFQVGQQKTQQASAEGQGNHSSEGHVAWLPSRHPVSSHAYNQGGTISASSVISLAEPSLEPASRDPDSFLRIHGAKESFLPHLTLLSPSGFPKPPYVKDPLLSSSSQHRAGRELSSLLSASEQFDASFQDVPINNGILEDYDKAVGMQIARIQIPKFDTKEDHNSETAKAEVSNPKSLHNHLERDAYITGNHIALEAKDNAKVGHNLLDLKHVRETASIGGSSILSVSLDSKEAEKQDEVIESVQEASHQLVELTCQNECTSMFILKDKENKFHLPTCSSRILHEERGLPRELSQNFVPTEVDGQDNPVQEVEPASQMKFLQASIPFDRLMISHESSSLQKTKMAEKIEERPRLISAERLDNVVMGLNQVQSSDELELGDIPNPQSSVPVSSFQGFKGFAEAGNIDNTTNIAACTLLSFSNRTLSIPKNQKNASEQTPTVLKRSVAWFANAIPEDTNCQKCEYSGTSESNSKTAISVSAPEFNVVPLKVTVPKSKIAEKLWNQSSNKEFLRVLLRKLNADVNEDHTLDLKTDSYEAMTLALEPSIVILNAINHYMPEKCENKNDLCVGKDTGNRTCKRAKKEKKISK